jgi:hypothetical protein
VELEREKSREISKVVAEAVGAAGVG